jgi:TPR repeat protein
VEKSIGETLRLYKLSAEQGYHGGQSNLAFCYRYGLMGLPRHLGESRRLYRLASEQGDEEATALWQQVNVELGREKVRSGCCYFIVFIFNCVI